LPIPPSPRRAVISYGPIWLPGESAIDTGFVVCGFYRENGLRGPSERARTEPGAPKHKRQVTDLGVTLSDRAISVWATEFSRRIESSCRSKFDQLETTVLGGLDAVCSSRLCLIASSVGWGFSTAPRAEERVSYWRVSWRRGVPQTTVCGTGLQKGESPLLPIR
jgi:hypothetical protein